MESPISQRWDADAGTHIAVSQQGLVRQHKNRPKNIYSTTTTTINNNNNKYRAHQSETTLRNVSARTSSPAQKIYQSIYINNNNNYYKQRLIAFSKDQSPDTKNQQLVGTKSPWKKTNLSQHIRETKKQQQRIGRNPHFRVADSVSA